MPENNRKYKEVTLDDGTKVMAWVLDSMNQAKKEKYTGIALYGFSSFQQIQHYVDGRFHRDCREGPAVYRENASGTFKMYCEHDRIHRLGGPAHIDVNRSYYYLYGKLVTKEQHDLLYCFMKLRGEI